MTMMMMVVGRMVIRIILGSYLQFGGTVSKGEERQMCRRGTSWFIHCSPFLSSAVLFTSVLFSSRVQCRAIHSHFSVSIAPHGAAHHCYFPVSLSGAFARGSPTVGGATMVQGTDYWDFTACFCTTRDPAECHTSHILTMFGHSEITAPTACSGASEPGRKIRDGMGWDKLAGTGGVKMMSCRGVVSIHGDVPSKVLS